MPAGSLAGQQHAYVHKKLLVMQGELMRQAEASHRTRAAVAPARPGDGPVGPVDLIREFDEEWLSPSKPDAGHGAELAPSPVSLR